jgi:hypothetical protein
VRECRDHATTADNQRGSLLLDLDPVLDPAMSTAAGSRHGP